jgi:branched-subunit amino acid transport protein
MRDTLWTSIIAVAVVSFTLKAAGPAFLGSRELPARANLVISLLAPALLTALVITNVSGEHWDDLTWPIVLGLTAAAVARLLKAPPLAAVAVGMACTALLRLIIS